MRLLVAFLAGLLFAIGLVISGMTLPSKVVGFLDVFGHWDPSLAFVMLGAVGVYATLSRLIARRTKPVLSDSFQIPASGAIDGRLVAGAAIFGVGWGLAGYCPGPAVVSAGSGSRSALVFVSAMLGGMLLYELWQRLRADRAAAGTACETIE